MFKAEDGRHVVDVDGKDVSPTTVNPASIPNKHPKAEALRAVLDDEHRLEQERDQLHQFQHKLDDARDKINKGGVSKQELDALGDDLDKSMPDAVRHKVDRQPGRDANAPDPNLPSQTSPAAFDGPRVRPTSGLSPR